MKLKELIALYAATPQVQSITDFMQNRTNGIIGLSGITSSAIAVTAVASYQYLQQTNVFVLNDEDEARYFFQTLKTCWKIKLSVFSPHHLKDLLFTKLLTITIL